MTGRASHWGQLMWYMEAWAAWGCSQELETRAGLGQQDCTVWLFLPLIRKLKICQEVTTPIPWLRALWRWAPSRSLIHILISGLSALPHAENTAQGSWVPFQFPQTQPLSSICFLFEVFWLALDLPGGGCGAAGGDSSPWHGRDIRWASKGTGVWRIWHPGYRFGEIPSPIFFLSHPAGAGWVLQPWVQWCCCSPWS